LNKILGTRPAFVTYNVNLSETKFTSQANKMDKFLHKDEGNHQKTYLASVWNLLPILKKNLFPDYFPHKESLRVFTSYVLKQEHD
jgi:hypothetical protein